LTIDHFRIVRYRNNVLAAALALAAVLAQRSQSFEIVLDATVAEAAPLFGPVREAEWAPGWAPHFVHPASAGQQEGAVFTTTTPKGYERLWTLTANADADALDAHWAAAQAPHWQQAINAALRRSAR
jgi:hypothetical protein